MARFKDAKAAHAFIEEIKRHVQSGLKGHAELKSRLPGELRTVDDALKRKDADTARLHLRAAVARRPQVEKVLATLDQALGDIDKVTAPDEPDFAAELRTLDGLVKSATPAKRDLVDWVRALEDLERRNAQVQKEVHASEREAMADWARVMSYARQEDERADAARSQGRRLDADADRALVARDAAALQKAKEAVDTLTEGCSKSSKSVQRAFDGYLKDHPPEGHSETFTGQFKRETAELVAITQRISDCVSNLCDLSVSLFRRQIPPPDPNRVLKALGLKPAQLGALKKALGGSEATLARDLDAMGKEAGVKATGREMVARLKKEGLL